MPEATQNVIASQVEESGGVSVASAAGSFDYRFASAQNDMFFLPL